MEEPKIRILPEDITNKIAAGEVVERPASVVKELVENSIDAKAKRIVVRLTASGLRLIEVIDDGIGMSEQNALLAIERHATSKIKTEKDLERISTFGFRGEALSSISAVSQFALITRRAQDETGTQIVIHGGILKSVSSVGCPVGTKITVNRLFFNTPVRLKFLKGFTTELSHCIDVIQKYALAHKNIGFKLIHNEKVLFDIPPELDVQNRLSIFWGNSTLTEMIPIKPEVQNVSVSDDENIQVSVSGFIGLPSLTRSHRSHQLFFVNQRPVYNRMLQYSLEEAYRGLLMVGRYPVAILFFTIPPSFVDVNIHPTKKEVKFREERVISKLITSILRTNLSNISAVRSEQKTDKYDYKQIHSDKYLDNIEKEQIDINTPLFEQINIKKEIEQTSTKISFMSTTDKEPDTLRKQHLDVPEKSGSSSTTKESSSLPIETGIEDKKNEQLYPYPLFTHYQPGEEVPLQIFDSYLVLPEEERLLIIDQHALHERLNFEQLKYELQDKNLALQRLAIPIIIEVPTNYTKVFEENLGIFEKIGIEAELFGDNAFQISAICYLYDEEKIKDVIFSILEELVQGDLFESENYFESLLSIATKACKKSIKAGDKLEPMERVALIQGFKSLKPPYTCPHGRPILIELTIQQMEKSFRRRT
ncbi:MAG TPA: DNA mismatch repair endonuclease MutL [Candidatus Hydrogenedens sp.]|nr:DNA mismatch repair endonuclease MutL [Candidatus Hydrogenedens sp.]HOL20881.1 DNA mismatch repair endonuclease MutL [Candidatus Hydrogenedens sp.]HPP58654.1 DNA mismatch repair endonuclease MutL [Candidatus Hydrogenedens sp.]